ncbi:hypothetical protein TorRG33x02_008560, partial [Trema orientale]
DSRSLTVSFSLSLSPLLSLAPSVFLLFSSLAIKWNCEDPTSVHQALDFGHHFCVRNLGPYLAASLIQLYSVPQLSFPVFSATIFEGSPLFFPDMPTIKITSSFIIL